MSVWAPTGTAEQVAWVEEAVAQTSFPWELLAPKLLRQTGKSAIRVVFSDLSARGFTASEAHVHVLDSRTVAPASRPAVWGLAWSDGLIEIERTLTKAQAQATWVCEAMHELDWFLMSPAQRELIWRAYHGGADAVPQHGHAWFDSGAYREWVGESLMIGGVRAFSPFQVADSFTHQSTPAVVEVIRKTLLPEPVIRIRGYGRYHLRSCRYVKLARSFGRSEANGGLTVFPHWLAAREARLAACRVCRPPQETP